MPEAGRWGKWRDVGQRIQIFNYNMNNFWGPNVEHGDYEIQRELGKVGKGKGGINGDGRRLALGT